MSKLYLYNFSAAHIYEIFFYNDCVAKTTCFYCCPCLNKAFISRHILKNSIIYNKKPGGEVIRCCLDCREQIISTTTYHEEPNDLFNDFKKS